MSTKAHEKFDMVMLNIGYHRYAVPRAAAMQFFDLCVGADLYRFDSEWFDGGQTTRLSPMSADEAPTISAISPAYFHQMLENGREWEARKREEAKKKEAA